MAWTFTTQVYLNKSEHILRLGGLRGQGLGRWMVGRQTYRGFWAESVWYELSCRGSGWGPRGSAGLQGWGWGLRLGEPGARRAFLSLACSPGV